MTVSINPKAMKPKAGPAASVVYQAPYPGALATEVSSRFDKVIDAREFLAATNTSAVNTANLQAVIDYYEVLGDQCQVNFSRLRGTILFAKQEGQTYAIKLKRGVHLVNDIRSLPDTGPLLLKLDDSQNCDFFLIDGGSAAQYYGVYGLLIDGNKTNNPTGGHGIRALSMDYANELQWLKIQNCKGAGIYLDNNTYVNAGNARVQNCNMVRCDGAGLFLQGALDTFLIENVMCEGNGLDGTAGSAGANYVFKDCTNQTAITMVSCRAEARTLAQGGGSTNILLDNMNGGLLNMVGGHLMGTNGNIRDSDIRIITSTARVLYQSRPPQNATGAVTNFIDDQVAGLILTRTSIPAASPVVEWNVGHTRHPSGTNAAVLDTYIDSAGNFITTSCSVNAPDGVVTANPGSLHLRTTAAGGKLFSKRTGSGNTGWVELIGNGSQSIAFAASVTPVFTDGNRITIGALTAPITVNVATGSAAWDRMSILFTQDATGGRTVTWNAAYKGVTSGTSGTASQKMVVEFVRDGAAWVQTFSSGWYS